ncbi:MAG: HD superfamily hydrolase [Candidatus Berkelbacteria bacterium Licking1014_2]|uniref:HD superfamily hydrolase n=1 Tax=Candidatus Berkelbacteria bacterium Licking1014_2 TaxID=2017146 RepID=A0A554LRQ4_9BACT|nr:MAG: HD superfamily hydrolase [Candidatus Berkelbacteria bacterium Licking1014_2]
MTTLEQKIQDEMVAGMKEKNSDKVQILRMLIAAIKNASIEKPDLTEADIQAVLAKEAKKRSEAAEQYRQAGREELATKESAEEALIKSYLPEQLSEEELIGITKQAIAETNAQTPADFGKVMAKVMPTFFTVAVLWYSFSVYNLTTAWQLFLIGLLGLINGGLIVFFVVSFSPIFQNFLTTLRQLLRFESLSHPLLIKLSLEAPGTYFHTISATNLAYQATKAIKGNAFLVRAGGYYHDIGKLKKPVNFAENQQPGNNPIENISPIRAAAMVINHIKTGVQLAKSYNLPEEVIDFIPQHHGTTLVSYFYTKAKERGLHPLRRDFRYPGPKPLSKEAAILMLADSIEAASRTMEKPTPEKIKDLVGKIISQKQQEGQLENSGLTDNDIIVIEESFNNTLGSMFSQRIIYPDDTDQFFQFRFGKNQSWPTQQNQPNSSAKTGN